MPSDPLYANSSWCASKQTVQGKQTLQQLKKTLLNPIFGFYCPTLVKKASSCHQANTQRLISFLQFTKLFQFHTLSKMLSQNYRGSRTRIKTRNDVIRPPLDRKGRTLANPENAGGLDEKSFRFRHPLRTTILPRHSLKNLTCL